MKHTKRTNRTKHKKKRQGGGLWNSFKKGSSYTYKTIRNTPSNIYNASKSVYNNRGNLMQSAKDVAGSKYLFSLIANPSNVHRMLFKNAYFINFINFNQIEKLYCQRQQPNCVVLKEGHLYSNNPIVVNNANNINQIKMADQKELINSGALEEQQKSHVTPQEANKINDIIIEAEIKSDDMDSQISSHGFLNETMERVNLSKSLKRLAFAKLNDALLTDDMRKNTIDPTYINFKPEYICFFELLTTYKYQVHRCLWYGGWFEWSFITNEMNNFILVNPELSKDFLSELWGTAGFLKIMYKYPQDNRDKIINAIKNGKEQEVLEETNSEGSSMAEKKIQETDKTDAMEDQQAVQKQSRFGRYASTIKRGINYLGQSVGSALGTNISKWRVIRALLKYYDIDPDKYNLNILKRTGIIKKNYPLFMDREARKAVLTAINIFTKYRNIRLNNSNINLITENYELTKENMDNTTLDQLLNKLMTFNIDLNGGSKCTRKRGKINRRIKMSGGSALFFNNIKFIFNNTFKLMVKDQLNNVGNFMGDNPLKIELVAKFLSDIVRCVAMMAINLCFTLANLALGKIVAGPVSPNTPHCYLSNLMYMYILFKMRILDTSKVNILQSMTTGKIPEAHGIALDENVPIGKYIPDNETNMVEMMPMGKGPTANEENNIPVANPV